MGKGGGGQSGEVAYPAFFETAHTQLLAGLPEETVVELANTAIGASPYTGETAYDPTTPLSEMTTELADFATLVDGLDAEISWLSFARAAKGFSDANFSTDDEADL